MTVAGDVPFGPPNEIKIKSTLDNMLVHLIFISLMILLSSLGNKTVAGSDRSCISSARFGIQFIYLEEP